MRPSSQADAASGEAVSRHRREGASWEGLFSPSCPQTPRQRWHPGASRRPPSEKCGGRHLGQSVLLKEASAWVVLVTKPPKHLNWWAADFERGGQSRESINSSQPYSVHRAPGRSPAETEEAGCKAETAVGRGSSQLARSGYR